MKEKKKFINRKEFVAGGWVWLAYKLSRYGKPHKIYIPKEACQ